GDHHRGRGADIASARKETEAKRNDNAGGEPHPRWRARPLLTSRRSGDRRSGQAPLAAVGRYPVPEVVGHRQLRRRCIEGEKPVPELRDERGKLRIASHGSLERRALGWVV